MTAKRQDAWTPKDDLSLAEITLQYIREGGTQLTAFEEVGELLNRTPAACGFRWNSYVRKQYEEEIKFAKAERNRRSLDRRFSRQMTSHARIYKEEFAATKDYVQAIDNMIQILRQYKQDFSDIHRKQTQQLEDKELQIRSLERENKEMRVRLDYAEQPDHASNDYQALVRIMDKVRKMSVIADEMDHHVNKINT